jgi:hypothetical protein
MLTRPRAHTQLGVSISPCSVGEIAKTQGFCQFRIRIRSAKDCSQPTSHFDGSIVVAFIYLLLFGALESDQLNGFCLRFKMEMSRPTLVKKNRAENLNVLFSSTNLRIRFE